MKIGRRAGPLQLGRSGTLPRMRGPARRAGLNWILVAGALFAVCRIAGAGQFDANDKSWSGCSKFRQLAQANLGSQQVQFVSSLDYGTLQPEDGVIFLNPATEIAFRSLTAFLASGGRAAVVDDYGTGGQLLARFRIQREALGGTAQWLAEGHDALPVAFPVLEGGAEGAAVHPLIRGVSEVVANRPVELKPSPGVELTPLLSVPLQEGRDALFAATGVIGDPNECRRSNRDGDHSQCGRLVVVADSSIFINMMMEFDGNREFALGLLKYLLDSERRGERGGRILVVSNRFSQKGQFPGTEGLRGVVMDSVRSWMEQLVNAGRDGISPRLAGSISLLAALGLALWAVATSATSATAWKPRFALPVPQPLQGGLVGRYAALASVTDDRAMLLLELHKTFAAQLCLRLRLPAGAQPSTIVEKARQLGQLDDSKCRRLQRLFAVLQQGEAAILSGRRLKVSDRRLRAVAGQIVDTLSAMKIAEVESEQRAGRVA